MRAIKFLLGVMVGSIIGAAMVLLIAPQSGEETQKMFSEKMETLMEEGRKAFDARREELEEQMSVLQRG